MSSLFLIYKSGAGSGKTYTLTKEYLKLALQRDNPWAYKQILAVTFTKKAANEMKTRILEWLLEFSKDEKLDENDKAKEILAAANEKGPCDSKELKRRAEKMHEHILHHYSDFSVQTIDSFVHKIIKSFSRDLKLSTDFEVEMDVEKVITEVVTEQLREMGENDQLTETLQDFLEHQLEEEKSTRLKSELVKFFQKNSDEKAAEHLERISAKTLADFISLRKEITSLAAKLKSEILAVQKQMRADISSVEGVERNLENWIKQTNFGKFSNYGKTPIKLLDKGDVFKKGFLDNGGEYDVVNTLILTHLDGLIPKLDEYLVVSKLVKNCYLLALIQDYKSRFEVYKEENNTILISDFTQIIQDVVKDNPAPFIYERLGERYKYYLIDEFQDTSLTQWQNFLPLITHTLANGNMAMIVGDSKQAIYRWRNGDFKLFANLPEMEYDADDFISQEAEFQLKQTAQIKNLDRNFRSSAEVVEFNNTLFEGLKPELSDTGLAMYSDFKQTPTINLNDGYVEFQLFGKAKDEKEEQLQRIEEIIANALERNFDLGDIAILTRKNATLVELATHLNYKGIKTSSQEGLLLRNNLKVRLIIGVLHTLVFPQDDSNNVQVFSLLEASKNQIPDLLAHKNCLEHYKSDSGRLHTRLIIWKYLTKTCGQAHHQNWTRLSAYDALLELVAYLELDQQADDYVESLLDFSFHAARRGKYSIPEFLDYWYDQDRLSLATAEDSLSVKLMSVHKSKGLEFPIVIYAEPFYKGMNSSVWYDLSELGLPLESTYYKDGGFFARDNKTKEVVQGFSEKYNDIKQTANKERSDKTIDDINLLYVALTRASQNLFVLGFSADQSLVKPVISVFQNSFGHDLTKEVFKTGQLTSKRLTSANKDLPVEVLPTSLKSYNWKNRLTFKFSKKALEEEPVSIAERTLGISIHAALADLYLVENWDNIWANIEDTIADEEILSGLKTLSKNAEWIKWFTTPLRILNEKHLLDKDGNEFIPDRVMEFENEVIVIDYKAGESNSKYVDQLKNYMEILGEVYDKPISGSLVYLREGRISKV